MTLKAMGRGEKARLQKVRWEGVPAVMISVIVHKRVLNSVIASDIEDKSFFFFFYFIIIIFFNFNLFVEQRAIFRLEALESLMEIVTSSTPQHGDLFLVSVWELEPGARIFFLGFPGLLCHPGQLDQL